MKLGPWLPFRPWSEFIPSPRRLDFKFSPDRRLQFSDGWEIIPVPGVDFSSTRRPWNGPVLGEERQPWPVETMMQTSSDLNLAAQKGPGVWIELRFYGSSISWLSPSTAPTNQGYTITLDGVPLSTPHRNAKRVEGVERQAYTSGHAWTEHVLRIERAASSNLDRNTHSVLTVGGFIIHGYLPRSFFVAPSSRQVILSMILCPLAIPYYLYVFYSITYSGRR